MLIYGMLAKSILLLLSMMAMAGGSQGEEGLGSIGGIPEVLKLTKEG